MSTSKLPARHRIDVVRATRAETDEQILKSWLDNLNSPHTRLNFATTGRRFLEALPMGLRAATVEDVRDALATLMVVGGEAVADGTARNTRCA
jgi:hypothetical protein